MARLASQESVELVLMDTGGAALEGPARTVLERAPCDVALLVNASGQPREGVVVVPFGAGSHDWAALELGAWFARATGAPFGSWGRPTAASGAATQAGCSRMPR